MPQHIVNLGDMVINWIEDQPVSRNIRKQMEQDGIIKSLINELKKSQNSQAQKWQKYPDNLGKKKDYLCLVMAYPNTDDSDPKYRVAIRPSSNIPNEWDAIGDIYVEPFPDSLTELLKEE